MVALRKEGTEKETCAEILVCGDLLDVEGRTERTLSKMKWVIHSALTCYT